ALVDLDARDHAVVGHVLRERHAVLRRPADGLVEQDRAADVLGRVGRGQQQLAVGAAVFLGVLDAHAREALGDGAGGLVDGNDALARRDHGQGGFGKLFDTHVGKARGAAERPAIIARGHGPWPGGTPFRAALAVPSAPAWERAPHSSLKGRPGRAIPAGPSTPALLLRDGRRWRAAPDEGASAAGSPGSYSSPSPSALPSAPTFSRRRVLVAPRCSMWSPLVNMMWSPAASRPASCSACTASRAASRVARPRLSKSIGNTSRISAIRRREPACRDRA